jgi:hypothetical protein
MWLDMVALKIIILLPMSIPKTHLSYIYRWSKGRPNLAI